MENFTDYRKAKPLDLRKKAAEELFKQHPDKVPLIFEPEKALASKEGSKFKVMKMLSPRNQQIARTKQMLQTKLSLAPDETLFIFKDGKSIQPSKLVDEIYKECKDPEDLHLYLTYSLMASLGS